METINNTEQEPKYNKRISRKKNIAANMREIIQI